MGSEVLTLLTKAREIGFEVRADPGRLVVRGPRSFEAVAHRLLEWKADVLALLAAEDEHVAWRVEAMRSQVPQRGAIPLLVAREVEVDRGCCVSCGEPLREGLEFRCVLCSRATWVILHEIREGVNATRS